MRIKVNGFYQEKTVATQSKKDGTGTYPIYNFFVSTDMNGQPANINVRAFSDKSAETIVIGAELELDPKTYNGFTYYQIAKQAYGKSGYKGYSKPEYNMEEYDNLFRRAYSLSTKMVDGLGDHAAGASYGDIFSRLLSTYIISATNAGVKVPTQLQPGQQAAPTPKVQKIAEKIGGEVVDNTPSNIEPMTENDIPF